MSSVLQLRTPFFGMSWRAARMVSLALWPIVMVAWLVAVPFVLISVAVGFVTEALSGIRLRRHDNSDGTDSAG